MMDIKELRIGNLVSISDYNNLEVLGISSNNVGLKLDSTKFISVQCDELQPIPLTEEWLLKFGFEKNENGLFKLFDESEVPILFNKDLNGWTCDGINFSVNGTQYVHQLQNLYFALTGEEL